MRLADRIILEKGDAGYCAVRIGFTQIEDTDQKGRNMIWEKAAKMLRSQINGDGTIVVRRYEKLQCFLMVLYFTPDEVPIILP